MREDGEPLVGREACVEALTRATARASAGRFAVVEVCAEAGMGKSHVLAEAGRLAREAGFLVCSRIRHTAESRVALVLDDLHRADDFSLELIEYLIRHPPDGAVLMVVAFRDARPPAGIVDAISRAGDAAWRIRLGPLREHDVRALLPHCSDRRRHLLLRASQGNPRYLHMLADLPDATLGELLREGGDFEPADQDIVRPLTASLAPLTATARGVAQAVAISGDHAALDLVACVAQLPVAQVVDAMDELCGTGLATMDGAWFAFQHPLLYSAARAMASPAWRTQAHARAAEYLMSHNGPPRLLAHHLAQSAQYGDEHAAEILLAEGDALVCRAPAIAVRLLGKALRILPPSARRPPATLRYAQALMLAGELDQAWDILQDSHPLTAEAAAVGADIARLRGDLDTATALAAPSQRAALSALSDDVAATAEHARRALSQPAALVWQAWAALRAGQVAAAHTHAHDAARAVDGLGTITLVPHVEIVAVLAGVETRLGNTALAAAHLARAYEVIDKTGQRSALPYVLITDADLQTRLGRLHSALDLTEQAASAAARMGSAELNALAKAVRIRPLLWITGPAAAIDLARELDAPRSPAWQWVGRLNLAIAQTAAEDGDPIPDEHWPADPLTRVLRLGALAQTHAAAGDLDVASRAASDAEFVALASGLDYEIGLAWYTRAYVAARAGRPAHAGELATRSATMFAACAAVLDEARARHLVALCAETANPERAHAELGLAKAGYAACGADWLLSAATRDQRRIAARNVRRRGSALAGTAVLTVRERQIADLVAGGLTNQQIADRLFLSRRTVESHLSRIFPKLAVRSRVAMARRLGDDDGVPTPRSGE